MLREALAQRSRNIKVTREIEEEKDLEKILPDSIETDMELQLDSRWWLERFFDKHNLSFVKGAFLIYAFVEVPRLLLLPFIVGRAQEHFVTAYVSAFAGELFIPIALLLIHSIYKSLVKLKRHTNGTLRRNKFVSPPILISEKELASRDLLAELDKDYRNRYVKPVMAKTLQLGLNLSFNKNYQLGSGAIATSFFFLVMFMRFVLNVLPQEIFTLWEPGVPEVAVAYWVLAFFIMGFDWFIIGMLAWTLFVTFSSSIQAAGNAIRIRPFESIKEHFAPTTALVFKTSFTLTFLISWLSPFMLIWSVLPPDPLVRQGALMFLESVLAIMIPVIVLSFLLPILKIHKGMFESRERVLLLKKYQLEDIKKDKVRKSDPNKYLRIREHLIQDYKDVQRSPIWLLNVPQMVELMGTVLLPIITFLISIRV